jgi:hypothetical protein
METFDIIITRPLFLEHLKYDEKPLQNWEVY